MAERKLNFNAPLLSVRRFTKPSSSSERENKKTVKSSPPRRKNTRDPSFEPTFNLEQVTKPVAVPFNWEQIPGKAKDDMEAEAQPPEEASVTPRMPPGKVLVSRKQQLQEVDYYAHKPEFRPQTKAYSFSSSIVESKYLKEGTTDDRGGLEVEDEADDVYSDALETLSSKESASLNCSASGLSGSEGAGLGKPSGTFSTDPQTRDFMMKRFLPAAKAMALEPPRYAAKKQPLVVQEQPREVRKVIGMDKRLLNDERGPSILPKYGDYKEEEEESEDENDDYESTRSISARGCGFFPRLCFRNSLSILGPIPGMKVRTPTPRKTSNSHSESKTESKTVKKETWDSPYNAKRNCGFRSAELHVVEKKMVSESKRLTYSGDLQRGRSSPSTHSRAASISPYRNRPSQSPFRRAAFLGVPKEDNVKVPNIKPNYLYNKATNKFEDISVNHRNKLGSLSMVPAVEKTLYVDSVNDAESSFSNPGYLDTKEHLKSASEDFENLLVSRRVEEEASSESIFEDIKCLNSVSKQSSLLGESDVGLAQEFSEMVTKGNLSKKSDQIIKEDLGNTDSSLVPSPLPPPLPKSPSESWLWRTAPSISLRNSFSRSKNTSAKAHAKMLKSNTSLPNTKWETIVKSSHLSHDHARYSEELVAHISQKSKKY